MTSSSPVGTGLLTAALVACAGIVLAAKTHAPNVFEAAYEYLAIHLDAPELCDKMSPDTVEHGPIFGNADMRIRYLQSMCFFNMAAKRRDPSLCRRVRTISTFWRDGSGVTEDACRGAIAKGAAGGNYGTGMVLGVMGYPDDVIRTKYPEHPGPDRSYDFLSGMTWGTTARTAELRSRLQRLPDFSLGDAAAIRQLVRSRAGMCGSEIQELRMPAHTLRAGPCAAGGPRLRARADAGGRWPLAVIGIASTGVEPPRRLAFWICRPMRAVGLF